MKKRLMILSSVLGSVFAITLSASLLPTVLSQFPQAKELTKDSYKKVAGSDFVYEYSDSATSDINLKKAIIGDKSINNGNYVLVLGSEASLSNLQAFYGLGVKSINQFIDETNPTFNDSLVGNLLELTYGESETYWSDNNVTQPEFIFYQDEVTYSDYKDYLQFEIDKKENEQEYSSVNWTYAPNEEYSYTDSETDEHVVKSYRSNNESAESFKQVSDFFQDVWGTYLQGFPMFLMFSESNVGSRSLSSHAITASDTSFKQELGLNEISPYTGDFDSILDKFRDIYGLENPDGEDEGEGDGEGSGEGEGEGSGEGEGEGEGSGEGEEGTTPEV